MEASEGFLMSSYKNQGEKINCHIEKIRAG